MAGRQEYPVVMWWWIHLALNLTLWRRGGGETVCVLCEGDSDRECKVIWYTKERLHRPCVHLCVCVCVCVCCQACCNIVDAVVWVHWHMLFWFVCLRYNTACVPVASHMWKSADRMSITGAPPVVAVLMVREWGVALTFSEEARQHNKTPLLLVHSAG